MRCTVRAIEFPLGDVLDTTEKARRKSISVVIRWVYRTTLTSGLSRLIASQIAVGPARNSEQARLFVYQGADRQSLQPPLSIERTIKDDQDQEHY